jgi:hypothetical protein
LPVLVIRPRRVFPPVEFCRGTRPSQAANCRAVLNRLISTTVATISDAVIGPMPGIVARRRAVSSCRACATSVVNTATRCFGERAGAQLWVKLGSDWMPAMAGGLSQADLVDTSLPPGSVRITVMPNSGAH